MPIPLIETPDALDAAIAASLQTHRDNLLRRVRNQGIRTRIALALSGCIALFALAAYLIGDHAATRFCALTAHLTLGFYNHLRRAALLKKGSRCIAGSGSVQLICRGSADFRAYNCGCCHE